MASPPGSTGLPAAQRSLSEPAGRGLTGMVGGLRGLSKDEKPAWVAKIEDWGCLKHHVVIDRLSRLGT